MSTIKEFDQKLAKHDWHWRFSDDSSVRRWGEASEQKLEAEAKESALHAQLHQAYVDKCDASSQVDHSNEERKQQQWAANAAKLLAVRITVGATSQAEIDAAAEEKRRQAEAEKAERIADLQRYDLACEFHDWEYWHAEKESEQYKRGFNQRMDLRRRFHYLSLNDPYAQLFYAWAAYNRAQSSVDSRNRNDVIAALAEVRLKLGVVS